MVANILPADLPPPPHHYHLPTLPPTLGVGSKGKNSTFSEYSHVAYQIKGNDECSNMVANILPQPPPPPDPWGGVKRSKYIYYHDMVMLHIKLKGMTHAATWQQIFYPQYPPPPTTLVMGSIGQNSTFSEHSHVAYHINGNDICRATW